MAVAGADTCAEPCVCSPSCLPLLGNQELRFRRLRHVLDDLDDLPPYLPVSPHISPSLACVTYSTISARDVFPPSSA